MEIKYLHAGIAALLATSLSAINAAEIQEVDLSNFGLIGDTTTTFHPIYDRDASADGAVTYGEMGWDPVKAVSPGIAVFNNVPPDVDKDKKQIYADCIMAPRTPGLIEGDGDLVDEACNDEFQSHKRYKMSANSIGPIDMVFNVENVDQVGDILDRDGNLKVPNEDQDTTRNVYRMIGKLNNHAGERFSGFRVELGFGLGADFVSSTNGDGLKIALNDEADSRKELTGITMAEFPGGLFYGPADDKHNWGFFSSTRAYYTVDTSALAVNEDTFESTALSSNYTDLVGKWLPITWVPTGYFFDDDGNPATDNVVVSWYDGNEWISYDINASDGQRSSYNPDAATLYMWATTPPTIWDDDGDSPELGDAQTLGGTLYAAWDAENEVYVLVEDGSTLENNEVNKLLEESTTLERRTGYMTGPIEDLANLNLNYYIEVAEASTWPTFVPADGTASFTLRITPIADEENLLPAWMVDESTPVVPPAPEEPAPEDPAPDDGDSDSSTSSSSSSGCSIGTGAPLDPTLPLLVLAGLAGLGLRRRMSA
jgi:hypothetical protein